MEFCKEYGCFGMWLISFLSGTVFPFSSDVLLPFFLGIGLDPLWLLFSATFGNTAGSMSCYYIGGLAREGWFTRMFNVSPEKAHRADAYIQKYGYWAAFFSFLAVVGEAIVIVLGNMRVCWWKVLLTMTLGKFLRYAVIILASLGVISFL